MFILTDEHILLRLSSRLLPKTLQTAGILSYTCGAIHCWPNRNPVY